MSIDDTQPALPGQTKRVAFEATRTVTHGDAIGSKLTRKVKTTFGAESWTDAAERAPAEVATEHGAPEDDKEAAAMGMDLVDVTHKVKVRA